MKRLLLPLAFLAIAPAAYCQEKPWSIAGYHSFKQNDTSVVISKRIDTFYENCFGVKGLSFDLDIFGGAGARSNVLGGSLAFRAEILPRVTISIGPALTKNATDITDFFMDFKGFEIGVFAGIEYNVRF